MVEETKLIRIKKRTWERLKGFGKMGQSFDQLLNQLMNEAEKRRRK